MQRINSADHLFHDGDPFNGIQGTVVTAAWLNSLQEEIAGVIEGAGINLGAAQNNQLRTAINTLIAGASAQFRALALLDIGLGLQDDGNHGLRIKLDGSSLVLGANGLKASGLLASKNVGSGLEDDGNGNLRVKVADASLRLTASGVQQSGAVGTIAGAYSVTATDNGANLISTATATVTLAKASTLWNGFSVSIDARVGVVTVTPNAADTIDTGAAGTSYVVPNGTSAKFVGDGVGGFAVMYQTVAPAASPAPQYLITSQTVSSGQYNVDTSAGPVTLTLPANPGAGTTVRLIDPLGTWGQQPVTLTPGGTNTIDGASGNFGLDVSFLDVMLIFKSGNWSFE